MAVIVSGPGALLFGRFLIMSLTVLEMQNGKLSVVGRVDEDHFVFNILFYGGLYIVSVRVYLFKTSS